MTASSQSRQHTRRTLVARGLVLLSLAGAIAPLPAQPTTEVPQLINYQGRVTVNGVNFKGSGQFKFALVDAAGTTTHWSNDGTSTAGSEPIAAITLTVTKGLYSVLLGDTTLPHMATIPTAVFTNSVLRLRVWFNDGRNGSQLLTPDQRIALRGDATMPGHVADGAITAATSAATFAAGLAAAGLTAVAQRGGAGGEPASPAADQVAPPHARQLRSGGTATSDSWVQRVDATPAGPTTRSQHTAVWTGSEMIIWGGVTSNGYPTGGGRYNPASNSWMPVSITGAPTARSAHTAIWTGSEMVVWGGLNTSGRLNDGGRYTPSSNTWAAVRTIGAPAARQGHTAVWTGSEMIVWGGSGGGYLNSGGRYFPAFDTWTPTTASGAPGARGYHTAVWTGTEMVIWGGSAGPGVSFDSPGGRYTPASDTWVRVTTLGAPTRFQHTAVWTGSEMIIWGGYDPSAGARPGAGGGRYKPSTDSWTALTSTGAPKPTDPRAAVWTGSEMIIWAFGDSGGRYDPVGNSWQLGLVGAGDVRDPVVWTGNEVIVWLEGSVVGRYTPESNSWKEMGGTSAPTARQRHTAVWTGSEMIVWGRYNGSSLGTGGRYSPAGTSWAATTGGGSQFHTAVWTGSEMIVWGGRIGSSGTAAGGRYDPAANTWTTVNPTGAPAGRYQHTAVWTGSEMIVWGGQSGGGAFNDGGRYSPAGNAWTPMTTAGAPASRYEHAAVWTGSEMIVWGGTSSFLLNDGGRYTPGSDSWFAVTSTGAPTTRQLFSAVWTGSEMLIWGGNGGSITGGRFNPALNRWTAMATVGAPSPRAAHTAVWTGSEMIVWGGQNGPTYLNTGGRYSLANNTWAAMSTTGAPAARAYHTAVWTGSEMIVWGGGDGVAPYFNDTFSYFPGSGVFRITGVVRSGSDVIIGFPSVTNCSYTLWRSDTVTDGTWIDTGLPALVGTGAPLTFTVPAAAPASRFFRVQAGP